MADGKRRKSTARAKVKAACQEKRIHPWKQHLLGKLPEVKHELLAKIIYNQVDIKVGQFTPEELDQYKEKLKIGKQQGLMKYPRSMEDKGI